MASKHRKRARTAKRVATVGVATATVTALTVATAPPPQANAVTLSIALAALATTPGAPGLPPMQLAPGAPNPSSIPDLTFGYGSQAYDEFQMLGAQVETALLNNVNLSGLLARLGYDPANIDTALGTALTQALAGVPVNVDGIPVLGPILKNAGITNVAAVLKLIGFNLANPLSDTDGLNIVTAGPPFTLLKFLGVDLGWAPGFPNSVADDINGTPYLGISPVTVLQTLRDSPGVTILQKATLATAIGIVSAAVGDGDVLDVRVPVVAGFGLGAFAAGMSYQQVLADLPNQPGGANYSGTSPLAGSITILPMILLRNPGRANGGLFARFYPVAALLGIDTVTPDTEVSSSSTGSGLNIPVGNTGIVLGGANLIPIKVDGTVEYDPLSDVPAWPNPISLANSAAALAFPTYILRGVTADSLTAVEGQATTQLGQALGNTTGPLALNLYLTVPVNNGLPLLEPVKLPVDAINLLTGANLNNPLATAVEPALTSLVNLGYTDVQRNVVDGVPEYDRTLDQGDVITPFGTLPSGVDWAKVPGDLLAELAAGTQQAISQGLVSSTPVVNPLATIAKLLGVNLPGTASTTSAPSPLTGITGLSGLTDALTNSAAKAAAGATIPTTQPQDPAPSAAKAVADNATETHNPIKAATASTAAAAKSAQDRTDASVKKATDRLDKIAKDGQHQIQKVVKQAQEDVQKSAQDNAPKQARDSAPRHAQDNGPKTTKKPSGAHGSAAKSSHHSTS
jgi:PE-PPE domain